MVLDNLFWKTVQLLILELLLTRDYKKYETFEFHAKVSINLTGQYEKDHS